jgi:hypothetical protein
MPVHASLSGDESAVTSPVIEFDEDGNIVDRWAIRR